MDKIREGKVTTDAKGKRIYRREEDGDDLPKLLVERVRIGKVEPLLREKMGWRDLLALAIVKKCRIYVTKGREEALLRDMNKQELIN